MAASGKGSGRTGGGKSTSSRGRGPGAKTAARKKAVRRKAKSPAEIGSLEPSAAEKPASKQAVAKRSPNKASSRTSRPRGGKKKVVGAAPVRPEEFRARLGSLENLLDAALVEAGAEAAVSADEGPVVRVAEGMLDVYARLGRTLEEGSVADALGSLGDRMRANPEDFGIDPDFERAIAPLLRFLYRSWWRVEVAGADLIPDDGPVVLVGNHSGSVFAYDGAMLRVAVAARSPHPRSVRPLLDAEVCELPVLGDVMARCGGVRASEENGTVLLGRDSVVAFFPEGSGGFGKPFRRRYELGSFGDGGFVRAALRAGAPIVPVAIVGAEETHPVLGRLDWVARKIGMPYLPLTPTFPWLGLGGLMPLPSRWRIEFGEPLSGLEDLGPDSAGDRRRVRRLAERTRERVQSLVDGAVERRGRAFF